jgi:hypothetical protein
MDLHRGEMRQGARRVGQHGDLGVEPIGGSVGGRGDQPLSAFDVGSAQIGAGQIQRAALPRPRGVGRLLLGVDPADSSRDTLRRYDQRIAGVGLPREHHACDDESGAGDGETAVDRQPEVSFGRAILVGQARRRQLGAQIIEPLQRDRADRVQRGITKPGRGEQLANLGPRLGPALRRHSIDLGQDHHRALGAEQIEHRQVFARLRHRAVVGGHHQQHQRRPRLTPASMLRTKRS